MNRDQVATAVNEFFSARLHNQPEALLERFAQGARVRMAGAAEASSIAQQTQTAEELKSSLHGLVDTWQWNRVDVHSLVIEGNVAAVRYSIDTIHLPTGTALSSELMDQFYFDDEGKVTEMIEFVDTAKVAQLST